MQRPKSPKDCFSTESHSEGPKAKPSKLVMDRIWDRYKSQLEDKSCKNAANNYGNLEKRTKNDYEILDKRTQNNYENLEKRTKAMEERRVVYVGSIPSDYTKRQLEVRFRGFGHIENIDIKSKDYDSINGYDVPCNLRSDTPLGKFYRQKKKKFFAFITYQYPENATKAIERGNDCYLGPELELNYGGRRHFVKGDYIDFDGKVAQNESMQYNSYSHPKRKDYEDKEDDYALLLKREQKKRGLISSKDSNSRHSPV